MRWLLREFGISPNAYYNFLKNRTAGYYAQKQRIQNEIDTIYHEHDGVDGYRSIKVCLERKGFCLSKFTVHNYMNCELNLYSVVRRKNQVTKKGRHIKYLIICCYKISVTGRPIGNGVRILHISFCQMVVNGITVLY